MVSDATNKPNNLSSIRECFQYTQIFNPFLFWAIARARLVHQLIEWRWDFADVLRKCLILFQTSKKSRIEISINFSLTTITIFILSMSLICLERGGERVKFFCHHAFSSNRMPNFFSPIHSISMAMILQSLLLVFQFTGEGKNNNSSHTDKLKFVGFCQFFDWFPPPRPAYILTVPLSHFYIQTNHCKYAYARKIECSNNAVWLQYFQRHGIFSHPQ